MAYASGPSTLPEAVPALGSASGGLRFELVLPAEGNLEERDDPFVSLSDTGRFSRVLLARIAIGTDTTIRPLALKIQRSFYRPYGTGQGQITNAQVDELWAREREYLMKLRGAEVVELLDLGPELMRSYPVTFCKKTRKYLHPLCPQCTALLEDCRDDKLLREFGLPTYSGSTVRYLYCSSCSNPQKAVLYTYSLTAEEMPKGSVEVRRRNELYRDLAAIARGDHAQSARSRIERIFPCFTCKQRDSCYPSALSKEPIAAERFLVPLSYYEFAMLPLELLHLHYDEFTDLAGGAPWSEVRRTAEGTGPGRAAVVAGISETLSSPFQTIFQNDTTGLYSIEMLRLKLLAFTQICRGVRALHARTGQPHLNLNPTSLMVTLGAAGADLPARWNFRTKVLDLGSPHRFPPLAAIPEAAGDVFIPSPDCDKTYTSPVVQKAGAGREEPMRVTIRSLSPDGSGCRAEVDVMSPRARLQEFKVRDIVRVAASSPVSWLEGVDLWGSIVEPLDGGFRVSVYVPQALPNAKVPVTFDGRVTFSKRFGIPCDLYSLGMILFRTILVNDQQDLFAVEDAVNRVLNKLSVGLEGAIQPDFKYVSGMLTWQIEAEKKVFDPRMVTYSRADRETRETRIPSLLWSDLLLFGFRLVSSIPDFSFCAHHADFDPGKPEALLDSVLQTLDTINTRLHVDLFGTADRDREISSVCEELIGEVTKDGLGGYEVEEDPGLEKAEFQPEP